MMGYRCRMATIHVLDLEKAFPHLPQLRGWWVSSHGIWDGEQDEDEPPIAWTLTLHRDKEVHARCRVVNEGMGHAGGVVRMVRLGLGDEVADMILDYVAAAEARDWTAEQVAREDWEHLQ